jgi:hypothetical protein
VATLDVELLRLALSERNPTPKRDVDHRLVDVRYRTAGSEQKGFFGYHALLSLIKME